jgi:tetratricopeptide (TPR) repeat protein
MITLRMFVLLAAIDPTSARVPSESANENSARVLFQRAEVKFNLGNFEAAAADYQAAYELDQRPAFLFNIGQCYRNLGNYERARFFYGRFLAADPRTPERRETEKLIAAMSKLLDEKNASKEEPSPASGPPVLAAPASASAQRSPFSPTLRQQDTLTSTHDISRPVYKRTWFWIGAGGIVAGTVAAAFLLSRDDPRGSLPSIDTR